MFDFIANPDYVWIGNLKGRFVVVAQYDDNYPTSAVKRFVLDNEDEVRSQVQDKVVIIPRAELIKVDSLIDLNPKAIAIANGNDSHSWDYGMDEIIVVYKR